MRPLAMALGEHFMVFTYDRRGRGESSDVPPYAVEREIDDLESLIGTAGGSAFVYGFSSGAILTLLAAARGLSIPGLALLEPPLRVDGGEQPSTDLGAQVAKLVVLGRREEALELWLKGIGVPGDIINDMRRDPSWRVRASVAHTLVYDSMMPSSMPANQLSAVATQTLVIASEATGDPIRAWSQELAEALPNGSFCSMKGQWHGVAAADLRLFSATSSLVAEPIERDELKLSPSMSEQCFEAAAALGQQVINELDTRISHVRRALSVSPR